MRVLVAEDEPMLAEAIAEGLRDQGMAVDIANDGGRALEQASVNSYDVIVLDRDMPVVSGDDVCRTLISQHNESRILMLTAAAEVPSRITGLSLGADDYLGKPFAFAELVARIRALARRARPATPPVLARAGIVLDSVRRTSARDGVPLSLTRKQFAVLEELLRADGVPVSAEELLERVWDENTDPFTNVVRVTVMTLRRRLGPPDVIVTVPGSGYRIA